MKLSGLFIFEIASANLLPVAGLSEVKTKIISGESATGKTSLVERFRGNGFNEGCVQATIGAAFLTKTLDFEETRIRLDIWDTAGAERYASLAPMYYRHASGALVVYDVTKRDSYVRAEKWIRELKEKAPKDIIVYLVGNKIDLVEQRAVSTEEGMELAEVFELEFIETSAKENKNVAQVFMEFAQKIADEKVNQDLTEATVIPVDNPPRNTSSNCCQ
ncbi:unnamed protein product [Oikopleura dioica]|uniref:Uncharacterized protein n=1 Tax=Oikopleura dioica TaxID=34765 RepID=E4WUU6_OIKDI|nr:unnamed protein product [Oikopleura dioica]